MSILPDGKAPYAPAKAITEILEFDRKRGLPTPITLETLVRVGVTDSLAPRTLQALRLLNLVDDDGYPTEAMAALRKAPESEYRSALASILRDAYADVFAFVDPSEDDVSRVRDAFRSYKPTGQQERMVTLFLGLCTYAGLAAEPPARRVQVARTPGRVASTAPTRLREKPGPTAGRPRAGSSHDASLPLLLQALLEQLPTDGRWTAARRARWLQAAELAVDMLYDIEGDVDRPED